METFNLTQSDVTNLATELVALQRSAYAVEAELISDSRIPQLYESSVELVAANLSWVVTRSGERVVAAVAYSVSAGVLDIERLIVDPNWHRRGLARKLICELPRLQTTVATGCNNWPARFLYEGLGFLHVADEEVLPGLWISKYHRAQ